MRAFLERRRYGLLLGWILVSVLVVPALRAEISVGRWLATLVFTVLLALALNAAAGARRARVALVGTAVVSFAAALASHASDSAALLYTRDAFAAAFFAIVAALLLRRVVAPGRVTTDRITAAICIYLILGLLWTSLYGLVHTWRPDAFSLPPGDIANALRYFSFVTLTTLGYGEVTPVHPLARSLAFLEAATGVLYVAVLVARLVALQIVHEAENSDQSNSS